MIAQILPGNNCKMTLSLEALTDLIGLPWMELRIAPKTAVIDPITHSITFELEGTMIPAGAEKLKLEFHQPINRRPHVLRFE